MIQFNETDIKAMALHKVGNKALDETLELSESWIDTDERTKTVLSNYFLSTFRFTELYEFTHPVDVQENVVYDLVRHIFTRQALELSDTALLAQHLYKNSIHPKIKGGEFYIVYFEGCTVDGVTTDAVGLFKSENKDIFLKIYPKDGGFSIESEKGINANKLDKGCLIFNIDPEKGYVVAIVDNTNKGAEAKYWTDDFLQLRPRKDSYTQTRNMLSLCTDFIAQLPSDEGKLQKANLMNRSLEALKEESVHLDTFAENVFKQPELVNQFKEFKETFEKERAIEIDDSFRSSLQPLKRKATGHMTTIRLDKNFDIHIHGGEQWIERGYDEQRGLYYYQLFFKEEK